jgi:hypothetical protein
MVSSIVFWPNVNGLMPALKRQGGKASNADAMVPLLSGLVYMPEGMRFLPIKNYRRSVDGTCAGSRAADAGGSIESDLPPEAHSFITGVCGFGCAATQGARPDGEPRSGRKDPVYVKHITEVGAALCQLGCAVAGSVSERHFNWRFSKRRCPQFWGQPTPTTDIT